MNRRASTPAPAPPEPPPRLDPALRSARGFLLLGAVGKVPLVTVELYVKWYEIFVVHPSGSIQAVDFGQFDKPAFTDRNGKLYADGSAYCDHVPNPRVVARWAEAHGYEVDERALELMHGRWELEAS